MEALRKFRKQFTEKRKVSKGKTVTAEGKESGIKEPEYPNLAKRRSSDSELAAKQQQEYKEQLKQLPEGKTFRSRGQTMSCDSYFMKDRAWTENAKDLTAEQMHALEMDIFKPLDFYEILFDRMKAQDNGEDGRSSIIISDFRALFN